MTALEEDLHYQYLLQKWFERERAAGHLVDLKFFPGDGANLGHARDVYETLTGRRKTLLLDRSTL